MRRQLFAAILSCVLLAGSAGVGRASSPSVPLEALPLIGGNGCVISVSCPGKAQGVNLTHGIHIDGSTDVSIKLGGHYTSLGGTIYLDDSSGNQWLTVYISDSSGGANRQLYEAQFTPGQTTTKFAIGVQGVASLTISPQGVGRAIDIVATLTPAAGAPVPAPHSNPPNTVATMLPGANVYLTGVPLVPFAWKPYKAAAAYFLQVWLTQAAPGQRVTSHSRINVAVTTANLHYELATGAMPKGTYHWRIAALSARGALISQWSPEEVINLS